MVDSITPIRRLLIANRGEIAIRVLRAANELRIATVAVYSEEDQLALHRFKADESYRIGEGRGPVRAYLDIDDIIRVAREAKVDAIHPGYGFLSENPDFAEAVRRAGIIFVGPRTETMRVLGDKVAARALAVAAGVPVMPATLALPEDDEAETRRLAEEIGYPLMLKASWGGGGRGMRMIESADQLAAAVAAGRREAVLSCGRGEVYLEKLVRRARHLEVQILGDRKGAIIHLFERDCTVQRRHQKVVERAPASFLTVAQRHALCDAALALAQAARYENAGTVEFLIDDDSGAFYFIEVNPRIQVEHTITEEVTGVDLVKAQLRLAEGHGIGSAGVPRQDEIRLNGFALQCRITTEDPEANFIPDYGRILAYHAANGFGIRLDGGTTYTGALITRFYDSLLVKVTAWAPTAEEAMRRMDRALREFRIRGVATNLAFLEKLINHPRFLKADYTTRFIDETPDLLKPSGGRDRATRLLRYIAETKINGNPEARGSTPFRGPEPLLPAALPAIIPPGSRQRLEALGPVKFGQWMRAQKQLLITDTSLRDAHQSLLATRLRTFDMLAVAPAYARGLPELLSLECWGGATFDVAMRFLKEDPWERLAQIREAVPNLLLQMLLRSANAVGYTNYPDNVVRLFVAEAARGGVDLFRVFDSLNWVANMRVAMDAVLSSGKLLEAAICYTGDIHDPDRAKYDLKYYVGMARELEAAGAHILAIKDMAGLCKPRAAFTLVRTLREEVGLPIHFHTHDTSGAAAASVLAAVDAGVDAVDGAIDSMSGTTSQPNLGSIVEALRGSERDTGLDGRTLRAVSRYFEDVRRRYHMFESDLRSGTSEVYLHEMPGGQYTNLREQARSLGIDHRWTQVADTYAAVNRMFGDIIKVTPTSKVVGDLAVTMVTGGISVADVLDPHKEIAFPDSVVSFFRGDIGQPPGGFPKALQAKVLRGAQPLPDRPGACLPAADLAALRHKAQTELHHPLSDTDFASYLMYPKVFLEFARHHRKYGDISVLPTPVFFHGMEPGQEISIHLEKGKTMVIRCLAIGEADPEGMREFFFELNGQSRLVKVADAEKAATTKARPKAQEGNPGHVAAPMPGVISTVAVVVGQPIRPGDILMTIEAMKMETAIAAERAGHVETILTPAGTQVDVKDLLLVMVD
ncbi:MAG: pyruvate carboxylase [Rhodospirillaceae bacterium]